MLIGVVGKPNTGKSTFFKAATLAEVTIASYPFTTIKANEGIGFVKKECPDKELKLECKPNHGFCLNNQRFIPVKLLDVAGLVPGAHQGKGLGNKFLDDLRQADVLIHIVDASGTTDAEGKATQDYDPCQDILFLEEELDKWFYGIISEKWKTLTRKMQVEGKKPTEELAIQFSGLKINENMIKQAIYNQNLNENFAKWSDEQLFSFVSEMRKISKPIIIAANKIDLPTSKQNIKKLKTNFSHLIVIPCSAESELALREAARDNLIEYVPGNNDFKVIGKVNEKQIKALEFVKNKILKENSSTGTGVQDCLNTAVFNLLKYIVAYPVENENHYTDKNNNILPDAKLMPPGSRAIDLAFAIHTDIGKKFVAAIDAKTKKRLSREYELKDNDIIRIMTK